MSSSPLSILFAGRLSSLEVLVSLSAPLALASLTPLPLPAAINPTATTTGTARRFRGGQGREALVVVWEESAKERAEQKDPREELAAHSNSSLFSGNTGASRLSLE